MGRRKVAHAAALVLLLACTACFSFRVAVPPDPEEVVGTLAIVRTHPGDLDLEKPLADEPVSEDDAGIHSLIKVLQVSRPMMLQWHWYSPDNQRLRSSTAVTVNAKARFLAYFAAWDTLPRQYYAGKTGNWSVVITTDGRFFARKEFIIESGDP
jgi:hypothetical protein